MVHSEHVLKHTYPKKMDENVNIFISKFQGSWNQSSTERKLVSFSKFWTCIILHNEGHTFESSRSKKNTFSREELFNSWKEMTHDITLVSLLELEDCKLWKDKWKLWALIRQGCSNYKLLRLFVRGS